MSVYLQCAFSHLSQQEVHSPAVITLHCPLRVRETDVCLLLFLRQRAASSLQ